MRKLYIDAEMEIKDLNLNCIHCSYIGETVGDEQIIDVTGSTSNSWSPSDDSPSSGGSGSDTSYDFVDVDLPL